MVELDNLDYMKRVGNTPFITLDESNLSGATIYCKLEFYNPTGSVKDRAAQYIIKKLLDNKIINTDTTIIESTSGNFGIALAAVCKMHNLKFVAVIDPNILPANEMMIRGFGAECVLVDEPDVYGGYLQTRIKKVKEIRAEVLNSYWVNQYGNPLNAEAYYYSLGLEICNEINPIDYIFVGVSSGGTITGVSRMVKEKYPRAKVIAVDIIGSVIFGGDAKKRYIPGIGSSRVPEILEYAKIDEVVKVSELDTIIACRELFCKHYILAGGSSGSVFAAIKNYFSDNLSGKPVNIVTVFPDKGERYLNTIYSDEWTSRYFEMDKVIDCHSFSNRN